MASLLRSLPVTRIPASPRMPAPPPGPAPPPAFWEPVALLACAARLAWNARSSCFMWVWLVLLSSPGRNCLSQLRTMISGIRAAFWPGLERLPSPTPPTPAPSLPAAALPEGVFLLGGGMCSCLPHSACQSPPDGGGPSPTHSQPLERKLDHSFKVWLKGPFHWEAFLGFLGGPGATLCLSPVCILRHRSCPAIYTSAAPGGRIRP